ncbi:hypothetical protein [Granulibacter bethesdensis]|uniref:hypothetical protein n=1 Tax=Granulibacter bethesdensis TaxID=364410 RepID=UPI0009094F90|nr:hypothetical protein [Granulibacter bethesdensis]APH58770.1 hypothetical protein GbCGDNIH7_7074 [Granulibacter bethesdensis]
MTEKPDQNEKISDQQLEEVCGGAQNAQATPSTQNASPQKPRRRYPITSVGMLVKS